MENIIEKFTDDKKLQKLLLRRMIAEQKIRNHNKQALIDFELYLLGLDSSDYLKTGRE